MAITKSAKKANRVAKRRRVFNVRRKRILHDSVKAARASADEKLLPSAFKAIDKAAKHGTISKNAASRTKSRLVKTIRRSSK
jgi:ribosomal protein S20